MLATTVGQPKKTDTRHRTGHRSPSKQQMQQKASPLGRLSSKRRNCESNRVRKRSTFPDCKATGLLSGSNGDQPDNLGFRSTSFDGFSADVLDFEGYCDQKRHRQSRYLFTPEADDACVASFRSGHEMLLRATILGKLGGVGTTAYFVLKQQDQPQRFLLCDENEVMLGLMLANDTPHSGPQSADQKTPNRRGLLFFLDDADDAEARIGAPPAKRKLSTLYQNLRQFLPVNTPTSESECVHVHGHGFATPQELLGVLDAIYERAAFVPATSDPTELQRRCRALLCHLAFHSAGQDAAPSDTAGRCAQLMRKENHNEHRNAQLASISTELAVHIGCLEAHTIAAIDNILHDAESDSESTIFASTVCKDGVLARSTQRSAIHSAEQPQPPPLTAGNIRGTTHIPVDPSPRHDEPTIRVGSRNENCRANSADIGKTDIGKTRGLREASDSVVSTLAQLRTLQGICRTLRME